MQYGACQNNILDEWSVNLQGMVEDGPPPGLDNTKCSLNDWVVFGMMNIKPVKPPKWSFKY